MNFRYFKYGRVKSTNDLAMKHISDGNALEGDVFVADWQELGRGHASNVWESEPGKNLLCSFILKPLHLSPANQFILTQLVSLGVLAIIRQFLPNDICSVKWPNDLYVNDEKVGGILFQNLIRGQQIDYSVAGLGVNVNQINFSSQLPNPVSLRQRLMQDIDIDDLLLQMAKSINRYYQLTFRQENLGKLNKEYLLNLYRIKEWALYKSENQTFEGLIVNVDEFGRLAVEQRDGHLRWFMFKEIEYLF